MGQLFSSLTALLRTWFPDSEYKIVMIGLDNAGKTTILYRHVASKQHVCKRALQQQFVLCMPSFVA
jgi:hypothetical protein